MIWQTSRMQMTPRGAKRGQKKRPQLLERGLINFLATKKEVQGGSNHHSWMMIQRIMQGHRSMHLDQGAWIRGSEPLRHLFQTSQKGSYPLSRAISPSNSRSSGCPLCRGLLQATCRASRCKEWKSETGTRPLPIHRPTTLSLKSHL